MSRVQEVESLSSHPHLDAGPGGAIARVSAHAAEQATVGAGLWRTALRDHAAPRLAVQYAGGPWLAHLQVGGFVTLTDPEFAADGAAALVCEVIPGPGETTVTLLVLESLTQSPAPSRDGFLASRR